MRCEMERYKPVQGSADVPAAIEEREIRYRPFRRTERVRQK